MPLKQIDINFNLLQNKMDLSKNKIDNIEYNIIDPGPRFQSLKIVFFILGQITSNLIEMVQNTLEHIKENLSKGFQILIYSTSGV
jgi:hypothetical protein